MLSTEIREALRPVSRGRPIALAAVLAVLLLAAAAGGCNRGGATAPAGPEAVPVAVARAERRNVPVRLRAIGNVEATSTVSIRPRAGGEVVQVAFEEGKDVRRGDLLFVIDPEPYRAAVAEAEARLARDEALLRKAEQDERRYAGLVEKDYVTKEQFDQVQANRSALRATIRGDQAALDAARIELGYCTIRSPIDGRAGTLLVHRGNLVKQNDDQPLVVLLQTRPIFVGFSVPEQYLPEIRRRAAAGPLEVTATVTAAAAAAGEQPHVGRLDFVDNTVDAATGTIRLKATFENEDRALWPGQFLDVRLTLSDEADALVVPNPAVQTGQQGTFVFVVDAAGKAQSRPVTVERTAGEETVIATGLEAGETVVTDGHLRLYPGAPVAIKPAVGAGADAPQAAR